MRTVCALGARSLLGMGSVCTGTLSLSAEPEAQLEEQVGENEGGELGWVPAFPTNIHSESDWPRPPPEEGLKCQMRE